MIITEEVKQVIQGTVFLSPATVNAGGGPHAIIAGKGERAVIFGIYKNASLGRQKRDLLYKNRKEAL